MRSKTMLVLGLLLAAGEADAQMGSPCGIAAYPDPTVSTANAMIHPAYGPIIVFNPSLLNNPAITRYMLAHECAHHVNGHVVGALMDPNGYMIINAAAELQADCHAGSYLKSVGDFQAVNAAIALWSAYGNAPTGPNYPPGLARATALQTCN